MTTARVGDFIAHMLSAIDRIALYLDDVDCRRFLADTLIQDAVIRNLEVIGEAARNVARDDLEFVVAHPEVPCRAAMGMRNQLSHGYFQIDLESVWVTVIGDLPALRSKLLALNLRWSG